MNKIKVSIGIPAFNAEENIRELVQSLLSQSKNRFQLSEIIVFCDGCSDNTVNQVKQINDFKKIIKVIDSRERHGMAYGVKKMLSIYKGDIFILLNDDIGIFNKNVLTEAISQFSKKTNIGLVSGNPQPLPGKNFIEKAGVSSFKSWEKMRNSVANGNNVFSCDGKFLALSRKFTNKLTLPTDNNKLGNIDVYLYYSCITSGFSYRHSSKAIAYYSFPSNLSDFLKWNTRNFINTQIARNTFGEMVDRENIKPKFSFFKATLTEFIKNPIGIAFIILMGQYCRIKAIEGLKTFKPTWESLRSTKIKLAI